MPSVALDKHLTSSMQSIPVIPPQGKGFELGSILTFAKHGDSVLDMLSTTNVNILEREHCPPKVTFSDIIKALSKTKTEGSKQNVSLVEAAQKKLTAGVNLGVPLTEFQTRADNHASLTFDVAIKNGTVGMMLIGEHLKDFLVEHLESYLWYHESIGMKEKYQPKTTVATGSMRALVGVVSYYHKGEVTVAVEHTESIGGGGGGQKAGGPPR